ncbi:MAG TPA: hypothetical protein PLE75_03820 [Ferruginibacter sp.]|nr:hypothetical protein [Ferruginibacter sp.]HRO05790.1 hypothetical protein [Ferruginibacter sp.]HRO95916.1 hypothetical protein [Ferruginibacter sp.]HRP48747.1 hypothetical protein [Ferruginibacter sp.]
MKSICTTLLLLVALQVSAQRISKVTMSETGTVETFALELDENVVVNVSSTGEVGTWGIEIYRGRTDRMVERLEPYTGRVDYFRENDNEAFRGKVRSIGMKQFTYYASFDEELLRGKLKSIGGVAVEYYGRFDEEKLRGKIKRIGSNEIQYYSSFDIAFAGKIKAIGTTNITYYSNTEDKAIRGKVRSIGNSQFTYYTSFERKELQGNMKRGTRLQYINGMKFFIK